MCWLKSVSLAMSVFLRRVGGAQREDSIIVGQGKKGLSVMLLSFDEYESGPLFFLVE